MAKVTMLNMAGAEAGVIELNDDIFSLPRPELKSEEAEESLSDRREPVATDREAPLTLHRSAAVSYSLRSQETIDTLFRRR